MIYNTYIMNKNIIIKKYKPTSPGLRGRIVIKDLSLSKIQYNFFNRTLKRNKFRNSSGNLVNYHRNFGIKKLYRLIDFKRIFYNFKAKILNFEKDPNRNALITLIQYENGTYSYILKNDGMNLGQTIFSNTESNPKIIIGSSYKLKDLPVGTIISNISSNNNNAAIYLRAAGTYGQFVSKNKDSNLIIFNSGKKKYFKDNVIVTVGIVAGGYLKFKKIGKAGANRWLGKRPSVRGVAMNPIDHPHGGGNGKSSGGRPSVSRWGKYTKGVVNKNRRI